MIASLGELKGRVSSLQAMQISAATMDESTSHTDGVTGELNGSVEMTHSPETLVQLCRLWPHIHKSPPPDLPSFCHELLRTFYMRHPALNLYDDRLLDKAGPSLRHAPTPPDDRNVGIDVADDFSYTSRSLSLVGVLGGILFILLTIAFVTLIKHRKRFREREDEGLNIERLSSHLRQIHQARSSQQLLSMLGNLPELPPAPPPDYETVEKLKEREEELPSYLEATGKLETVYEDAEHTDSPHTYLDELADSRTTSLVVHGTPNFQTTESSTTSRQNQRDASQLSSVIRRENETG